ncbi:DUF397 domain-containing protein [Streptomyces sp. NBC_00035]|uniref:DUF397 domain-containing protein n=1 Tax=Streptomyces sp. NBC_00035 TaxID=2903614 RepID=UPI0032454CF1
MAEHPWRKSSWSASGQSCLQVARASGGIRVRDSKNPTGPQLLFPVTSWDLVLRSVTLSNF